MLATIINQTIDTLMSVLHCYGAKLPQKFNVDNVFQTFFADFNKKSSHRASFRVERRRVKKLPTAGKPPLHTLLHTLTQTYGGGMGRRLSCRRLSLDFFGSWIKAAGKPPPHNAASPQRRLYISFRHKKCEKSERFCNFAPKILRTLSDATHI